jgi:hypothetical protein
MMKIAYRTDFGVCICGKAEETLTSDLITDHLGKVNLILTSPPFPLNRKKKYGNLQGEEYVEWIASFASSFRNLLDSRGSIIIEVGNTWEPGKPTMSTLALEALLALKRRGEFTLCQQFVWYNPAKLPSPAQWVNVERTRVKDSFTHI